jgi:hypothetical protein
MQRPVHGRGARRLLVAAAGAVAVLTLGIGRAAAFVDSGGGGSAEPVFPVLPTALIDPSLLPADPLVVTDADLATAGATTSATMAAIGGPNVLVVDDDRVQCPNADFTTAAGIQLAANAAPPGAMIKVCPGRYTSVTVDKAGLVIQAPRHQGQANGCPSSPPDPTQDAIIDDQNAAGLVQLLASNVVFEGFTIQNNRLGAGVRTSRSASGFQVDFDVVQGNSIGVDLNSDGAAQAELQHDCFRNNRDSNGVGREIDSSAGYSNVLIAQDLFTGASNGESIGNCSPVLTSAGDCVPSPIANVTVSHNDFVDDGGIGFIGGHDVAVTYNMFLRCFGAAVNVNNVVNLDVRFNFVDGASQPFTQGIAVRTDQGLVLNATVTSNILRNLVGGVITPPGLQVFGFGISVRAAGVSVKTNRIEFDKGSGIFLGRNANGDIVLGNLIAGNGLPGVVFDTLPSHSSDGIKIVSGALGNTIDNNRLGEPLVGQDPATRANVDHDCHDSNPRGANLWIHNVGFTENQPGLCVKRTA